MSIQDHDLPYRVEVWDDSDSRMEEVIALVGDHAVAQAAYKKAGDAAAGKAHYSEAKDARAGR